MGTDPTERAFFRDFRDFNPLMTSESDRKRARRLFPGGALKRARLCWITLATK